MSVNDLHASRGTPRSEGAPSAGLRGHWLTLARVAWIVVALSVFGLDAVGLPHAYAEISTVCTGGPCVGSDGDMLSPEDAGELREMGMSLHLYAGLTVTLSTIGTLAFSAAAAVIFLRRSDDKMALLASFTLLVFGGAAFTGTMQYLVDDFPALWWPIGLLEYFGQVAFSIFFLTFPDGRFVPRWTRWLAVLWAVLFVPNVFFPDSRLNILGGPLFAGYVGSLVLAQVYRYARVSNPAQRQQTKWVVYGFAVAIGGFAGTLIIGSLVPAVRRHEVLGDIITGTLIYGFILLIPISIGVAILRSRLYDIDVVINRTLVYGALTLSLALIYFGGVVVLQATLHALVGQESSLAVVASTLLIAALFTPLRRRIQSFIDRRFYRKKYDATRVLATFSGKLRSETDLDRLGEDLLVLVRETVQPEHVSLWLRASSDARGRA